MTLSVFEPVSDPSKFFEVGTLYFRAPTGEGWGYLRENGDPAEFALFLKRGDLESPGFGASAGQFHADDTVTSGKDLWDYVLTPLRNAIDFQESFEIHATECESDESFSKIGVRCLIEGRHRLQGFFWIDGMNQGDMITVRGHGRVVGANPHFSPGG